MQRASWGYLIFGIALLSGCTKGIPEISALQSSIELPPTDVPTGDQPTISAPTFGGLPTGSATVVSIIQPLIVTGECSPQLTGFEVSKDNGTTWLIAPTAGGDLDCSDGTFSINISNPSSFFGIPSNAPVSQSILVRGITQSGPSGSAEFVLNYDPPKISIANALINEDDGSVDLILTLNKSSTEAISVAYTTTDGSAMSASDYTSISGTLSFAAGETSKTVTVNISPEALYENDENFFLDLSSSINASIFVPQATVTIMNDDVMPMISLASSTLAISESDGIAQMSVNLSSVSGRDTIFNWNTSDDGAIAGNDYVTSGGSTVIPAGSSLVLISVPIINDPNLESSINERFKINLDGATNATLGSTTLTTITITNDDVPVVLATYPAAPKWNDYVRQIDTTTTCDGSEVGDYFSCIHGGERRKVVVTGHTSCTGLTLYEALNVFDWTCDNISGTATFYSKGLKPGKGLRDLLNNGTGAWLNNSVTIKLSGDPIGVSTSLPWWSNPTVDLATMDNSDGSVNIKSLSSPETVYFINSDRTTFGYQIAADKIAVVTLGSSKFIYRSTADVPNCDPTSGDYSGANWTYPRAFFCGGVRKFIWFEADTNDFVGYGANTGILAYNWRFSRIHRSRFSNGQNGSDTHYGLNLIGSSKNLITNLDIYHFPAGVQTKDSSNNIFRNLNVASTKYGATHNSLIVSTLSQMNRFYDIRVSNHSYSAASNDAVRINGSNNSISRLNISNANVSTSGGGGLSLGSSASNNIFTQIVTSGLPSTGILIYGADNNTFSFLTAANNTTNGIKLDYANAENNFVNSAAIINTGSYAIASALSPSYTSTSGNHFFNLANSATAGIYNVDDLTSSTTGYTLYISTTSDFVRKPASDSHQTSVDESYSTLIGLTDLWSPFDSFFRNWGKDAGMSPTFPNSAFRGRCDSAMCSIWDWRVANGSPLHNTSIAGNTPNPAFTTGTCINGLRGDPSDAIIGPGGIKFLKNAIEIDGDRSSIDGPFIGNENGLCESGEHCIYAPNIGAYQGEGTLSTNFCTTTGTEVLGAKIFTYPTTGI